MSVLTITNFALREDPHELDADGYPKITAITLGLSDGRTLSCSPDGEGLATIIADTGAVFDDHTDCEEDDAEWLTWAKQTADNVTVPEVAPEVVSELGSELSGDLSGGDEVFTDFGTEATEEPEAEPEPTLKRPGCKRPWQVKGWQEGKLLATIKRHRGEWGTCEYRVLCLARGRYRLVYFQGGRKDLTVGTEWDDAASMFRALLAQGTEKTKYDANGRRQGTRMTINQFFERRRRSKKNSN